MKFCCGVTLYYPRDEELKLIDGYRKNFEKVFVFDNTDSNKRLLNQEYFKNKDSVEYISKNSNEGLSVAFNMMCQKAIENGFDYICLLDQDSDFSSENIFKMINHIKSSKKKNVGIYVPEIVYKHLENNRRLRQTSISETQIKWGISSGSFINLDIYKKTDGFDENYFIDRLDYDYCIKLNRLGYKLIKIKSSYLYQDLGQSRKGIIGSVSQHSPIRHYYMFRNRLYFYAKNESNKVKNFSTIIFLSARHFLKVIFTEDEKREKIKMMVKGYKDYHDKNMGKLHFD